MNAENGISTKQRILFVDDEPAVLDSYTRMLRQEFDLATATSGADALALLNDHGPFAMVISDMHMAGMDGVELLKRARHVAPNTVRLILTGHADLDTAVKAVNEGFIFRFLTKPCDKPVLVDAIRMAFAQYNRRKEPRVRIQFPVYLYRSGKGLTLQSAHTVDISSSGARLAGVQQPLETGEVLKVKCGNRKADFRVVWTGTAGSSTDGQVGLECLTPSADIWAVE